MRPWADMSHGTLVHTDAGAFSPSLSVAVGNLAAEIDREHRACTAALADAVTHAIRAGQLLLETKEAVPHGGWLRWLADNFDGSVRTAQTYMRFARRPEDAQRFAHLGIGGAARALSERKREDDRRDA